MTGKIKYPKGADYLRSGISKSLSLEEQKLISAIDSECNIVVKGNLSTPIQLVKRKDIIHVYKLRSEHDNDFSELSMTLRLKNGPKKTTEWWPIEMKSLERTLAAEKQSPTGRTMINVSVQDELLEVADAWGKNLIGQRVLHNLSRDV